MATGTARYGCRISGSSGKRCSISTAATPVQFSDLSTGVPSSWSWDFGDGATSTLRNPSHVYASPGTYTATLTAWNACGVGAPHQATVEILTSPTASFTHDGPKCATQPVQLTDTSTGGATSWLWSFGDGTTSTLRNPTHAWAVAGNYTVTLTASNTCGAGPVFQATVSISGAAVVAGFSSTSGCAGGQAVQCANLALGLDETAGLTAPVPVV